MAGPFDIDARRVGELEGAFAPFVNDLLVAEIARSGLHGFHLDVNSQVNTADGGVDAALSSARATDWLPEGSSAWQFKSSDRSPKDCRDELREASFARELMAKGATYVLVLGRPLVKEVKERRLAALQEEAEALGLTPEAIRVYDGNQLARWISTIPALALDRRLGGPGPALLDFGRWSTSSAHQERWVDCVSRQAMAEAVTEVALGRLPVYRLEGGSGLGKTRLAMETLRRSGASGLVLYAPLAEQLQAEAISYLCEGGKTSILVVDNCSRSLHQSLVEQVDPGSVRLLTIGIDAEERLVRTPIHQLPPALDAEIDAILLENVPGMWPEASRAVREYCFGNVATALLLGERLVRTGEQNVAALLRQNDVRQVLTSLLPENTDFLSCAVLALLERVGWDRDKRYQLELLCDFAGVDVAVVQGTAGRLEASGLLTRHGRYRSLTPQPLAVVLAASAWESYGDRLLEELAPRCDSDMLTALFRRAAELGRFAPLRDVLFRLLARGGPFGSLERMEEHGADLLVQLAIVLPDETALHLSELIAEASLDTLKEQNVSRRSIVRSLEKLAWHSRLFSDAADCLLRLALAENETWANNATNLWFALFGVQLPTTAASPSQRIDYLRRHATDESPVVRRMVATAIAAALHPFETAMVSGELQEGTIVEPRGGVRTVGEATDYRLALLGILDELRSDGDAVVADEALQAITQALHPLIGVEVLGERLGEIVIDLDQGQRRSARRALEGIIELRANDSDPIVVAAKGLLVQLPADEPLDRLRYLASSYSWDWTETKEQEFQSLIDTIVRADLVPAVAEWLRNGELAEAWRLGNALGNRSDRARWRALVLSASESNIAAIAGYLIALSETDEHVFDRFLDIEEGRSMSPLGRLYLTTIGPKTADARARLAEITRLVPVAEAAGRTASWQSELSAEQVVDLLQEWLDRMESDRDFAALVQFLQALVQQRSSDVSSELKRLVLEILQQRLRFPGIGHQRYAWCAVAAGLASDYSIEVARLVLDLVSAGAMVLLDSDSEAAVLRLAAAESPEAVWGEVAGRIVEGDWRISMALRGWFAESVPLATIADWIGDSESRAEVVASIADAGADVPSAVAIFLLDNYPENEGISASLAGDFLSGGWVGRWSDRLQMQIDQMQRWRQDGSLPASVRTWAAEMSESLRRQRGEALEREAERDF